MALKTIKNYRLLVILAFVLLKFVNKVLLSKAVSVTKIYTLSHPKTTFEVRLHHQLLILMIPQANM